jgi:hypothetical protein
MANTFGSATLYRVEELANGVADVLVHVGFEVGDEADRQNWDAAPMSDMSGVYGRLGDAQKQLEFALGLIREYETHRKGGA